MKNAIAFALLLCAALPAVAEESLPVLNLPDPKIAEVYRGNWENTLKPCICPPSDVTVPKDRDTEPQRPWKVDVDGHYPGWYPGVDMKHMAAAYLACTKDIDLVLRAWKVTTERYQMPDGAIRAMTMNGNPNSVVPETTGKENVVYYPLRLTACIDYILLGDMIFRFTQDKAWLKANINHIEKTCEYIYSWMNYETIDSDSYDLDQVYRQIDGVATAALYDALGRAFSLKMALLNGPECIQGEILPIMMRDHLKEGAAKYFWEPSRGYFGEHLIYNNISRESTVDAVSSELDANHQAQKAIDGIIGCGFDAFGVGRGEAGKHEWAAASGPDAWIRIKLPKPMRIGGIILVGRSDPSLAVVDRLQGGVLEFSDGSTPVDVDFFDGKIQRQFVEIDPREVSWVKVSIRGAKGGHPGLSEIIILPADEPYKRVSHGMTDSNFAMLGFGVANDEQAAQVWHYFQDHEAAFYEYKGLHAPTWIAEDPESYTDYDLNRRAPRKDCVAMGRTWRYDALMRYRMHDGDGIYRTITYANELYDRPSGGGPGFFAERYGLGRFQPGDESQANVLKYSEYPAVYNSTVVQQCLLGLDVGYSGEITIAPCVPASWYEKGFGIERPGLLKDRDIAFTYSADKVEGWVSGKPGEQVLLITPPPKPGAEPPKRVTVKVTVKEGERVAFTVQ